MRRNKRFSWCFLVFIFLCNVSLAVTSPSDKFFGLVNQRLVFMKQFAAAKFVNNYPINLTIPERVAVRAILRYALELGFDVRDVRSFVTLELLVGKSVQQHWYAKWKQDGFPKDYKVQDLRAELMPQLTTLDKKMLDALLQAMPEFRNSNSVDIEKQAQKIITAPFVTVEQRQALIKSALKVHMSNSTSHTSSGQKTKHFA